MLAAGCVIPPSLGVEKQDAGQNSPPSITKVIAEPDGTELVEPGPKSGVTFKQGMGSLSLSLLDTDLGETLEVRVFVDYDPVSNAVPPRTKCTAGPSMTPDRSATCLLAALCVQADIGQVRDMTVVVFDRVITPMMDAMPPLFQWPGPDGLSARVFFHLACTQ